MELKNYVRDIIRNKFEKIFKSINNSVTGITEISS